MKHRGRLAAGEMWDLSNERPQAVEQYQALLAEDPNAPQADMARKLLKSRYTGH
jgi:hypothetical protein